MSPQDDLFAAQDAAGQAVAQSVRAAGKSAEAEDTGGRGFESRQPAPAAPVDRTTIAYYAALQSYYRFGAWPEGVARC